MLALEWRCIFQTAAFAAEDTSWIHKIINYKLKFAEILTIHSSDPVLNIFFLSYEIDS